MSKSDSYTQYEFNSDRKYLNIFKVKYFLEGTVLT